MPRYLLAGLLLVACLGCKTASRGAHFLSGNLAALTSPIAPAPARATQLVRPGARLSVVFIGHATALVQIDDKFILTDPVFTETVGQISKRLVAPGLTPDELPLLDAVVVSHMHFDHLSLSSLDQIALKTRHLFTPSGGLVYVPNYPFAQSELEPWESVDVSGLRVTAVPVKHNGWRYGLDAAWMRASYCGYAFTYHGLTVYFGGDTAYEQSAFIAARERLPPIHLALLPIAPIEPREYMKRYHVSPDEALRAFLDLGAAQMMPIHFDTFVNSFDRPGDATRRLSEAIAARGIAKEAIVTLAIGEQHVFVQAP